MVPQKFFQDEKPQNFGTVGAQMATLSIVEGYRQSVTLTCNVVNACLYCHARQGLVKK